MSKLIVKVEVPHSYHEDWHELIEDWMPDSRTEWRDSIGRRNGNTYRWTRYRCNNTRCSCSVLVRQDSIEQAIEEALG